MEWPGRAHLSGRYESAFSVSMQGKTTVNASSVDFGIKAKIISGNLVDQWYGVSHHYKSPKSNFRPPHLTLLASAS